MSRKKQTGAGLLIITVILLLVILLSMIYATRHSIFQAKSTSNQYSNNQAYEAAQAGLEFGLVYLSQNPNTIIASATGGYINYGSGDTNLTNVTLANNSRYSVVYTNPTQNNFNIITITSTGTNADGTSTKTLREQVSRSSSSLASANIRGSVTVSGGGGNITGATAIHSGGSADPAAVSGGGTINANDSTLASMSNDEFFMSVFGVNKATKQAQSTYYASGGSVPWGSLSGSVWINGDTSMAGNTTDGTVANPVIVIINGNFTATGTAVINGAVYATGNIDLGGTNNVNGIVFSEGNIHFGGTSNLNFNTSIVNNLLNNGFITTSFAKIPGSWKDY